MQIKCCCSDFLSKKLDRPTEKNAVKWEWLQAIDELGRGFLVHGEETKTQFVSSDGRASHIFDTTLHAERN